VNAVVRPARRPSALRTPPETAAEGHSRVRSCRSLKGCVDGPREHLARLHPSSRGTSVRGAGASPAVRGRTYPDGSVIYMPLLDSRFGRRLQLGRRFRCLPAKIEIDWPAPYVAARGSTWTTWRWSRSTPMAQPWLIYSRQRRSNNSLRPRQPFASPDLRRRLLFLVRRAHAASPWRLPGVQSAPGGSSPARNCCSLATHPQPLSQFGVALACRRSFPCAASPSPRSSSSSTSRPTRCA
jgi:hypothetical protein